MSEKSTNESNVKVALKLFLKTMIGALMCLFVYMSFIMIFDAFGTHAIGHTLYDVNSETGKFTEAGTYYNDDSDTSMPTASDSQRVVEIRSKIGTGARVTRDVLGTVFMLIILGVFAYSTLWSMGDRDANAVQFGHRAEDKLRGLRIGSMAAIPSFLVYLFFVLGKFGVASSAAWVAFRFLNIPFLFVTGALADASKITTATAVPWTLYIVGILYVAFVPAVSHVAYWLGYRHVSLSEKVIYVNGSKKKKHR